MWMLPAVLATLAVGCQPRAASAPGNGLENGVVVSGEGKATGAPDIAHVRLGVRASDAVAQAATQQASQQMATLIATLKQNGVADRDIRTQQFSVAYEEPPRPPPEPMPMAPRSAAPKTSPSSGATAPGTLPTPESNGRYVVTNVVEVTVRDLNRVGALLSAATNAGANEVWGIDFEIENPKPFEEKARAEAVADARAKAASLAKLAGISLGEPIAVRESGGGFTPMFEPRMAMSAKAEVANVPVERGELTITRQVDIVYAILPSK